MKLLNAIPAFTLVLCAAAEPTMKRATPVKRDLATIQSVLSSISSQVDAFDTQVKAYNGGDTGPLLSASDALLSTLNSGTTTVSGTSALTDLEAAQVAGSVQTLSSSVATVVNDLIGKKDPLAASGQGPTVLKGLQDQKAASQSLATAVTSKVPDGLKEVANQLSAGIADSLQRGIDAYSDVGGTPPSSSTPAGPTSSPPAGPTSSPPAGPTSLPPPGSSHSYTKPWGNYTSKPKPTGPPPPASTTELPPPTSPASPVDVPTGSYPGGSPPGESPPNTSSPGSDTGSPSTPDSGSPTVLDTGSDTSPASDTGSEGPSSTDTGAPSEFTGGAVVNTWSGSGVALAAAIIAVVM